MKQRYINPLRIPKSVAPGRVLAHNHVEHTLTTRCGVNGFRAWTWAKADKPRNFTKCNCGWSGLPHVAMGAFECVTEEELARLDLLDE
jgi:hypothetical protein